jgi:hypothetical protein
MFKLTIVDEINYLDEAQWLETITICLYVLRRVEDFFALIEDTGQYKKRLKAIKEFFCDLEEYVTTDKIQSITNNVIETYTDFLPYCGVCYHHIDVLLDEVYDLPKDIRFKLKDIQVAIKVIELSIPAFISEQWELPPDQYLAIENNIANFTALNR